MPETLGRAGDDDDAVVLGVVGESGIDEGVDVAVGGKGEALLLEEGVGGEVVHRALVDAVGLIISS